MRILFTRYMCPHCRKAKFGVLKANLHLPVGSMIDMVEIMNGDPRVQLLNEDVGQIIAPVLAIDHEYPRRYLDSYVKAKFRHVLVSSFGNHTTETLVKDILYEEVI